MSQKWNITRFKLKREKYKVIINFSQRAIVLLKARLVIKGNL